MSTIREAWEVVSSSGRFAVSGPHTSAHKIQIRMSAAGAVAVNRDFLIEEISADEWREFAAAVERRLIQRGDPQR